MIENKIREIIEISWNSYKNKVANKILDPRNEKMMQLHLAQIFQTIIPLYEYKIDESIKLVLEMPVNINRDNPKRIIDIVLVYTSENQTNYFPIEIKCFRNLVGDGSGRKRGAQNLGMFDYWSDIENIEQYSKLENFSFGTQLTLTDDNYYVSGKHSGLQVKTYSTSIARENVSGILETSIVNRSGKIEIEGIYSMNHLNTIENFSFIKQESNIA